MNPLNHVAIIMDGNGRWGLKYRNSRNAGHKEGLKTVETIIKSSIKNKIKYLTLYAFSTENWKRPKKEINFLFNLLENFLQHRINELHKQGIKLKIIGVKNFSLRSVILFIKKFSNKLNKKFISFFGLFQFSVENANNVKNFILFLIVSLIIFSTVFKPAL